MGEFVANMFLGMAASAVTLVVIPGLTGKTGIHPWVVALGLAIALGFAILAVYIRVLTEERRNEDSVS